MTRTSLKNRRTVIKRVKKKLNRRKPFRPFKTAEWANKLFADLLTESNKLRKLRLKKRLSGIPISIRVQKHFAKQFFVGEEYLIAGLFKNKSYDSIAKECVVTAKNSHRLKTNDKAVKMVRHDIELARKRFEMIRLHIAKQMLKIRETQRFEEATHFLLSLISAFNGHLELIENQLRKKSK